MRGERTGEGPVEARFDLIDRFERVIDMQAALLGDVDEKAGHVARLVALVLGVVVSALSIGVQLGGPPNAEFPTLIAFGLGTAGLIVSMSGAIITYLSSKIKLGVHPDSAKILQKPSIGRSAYSRLVANSYAGTLEENRRVINANAKRLRYTLASLVAGISYLTLAVIQYVAIGTGRGKWATIGIGSLAVFGVCWFVVSGRYLVLEER